MEAHFVVVPQLRAAALEVNEARLRAPRHARAQRGLLLLRAGERDIRIKRLDERALIHLEFLLSAGLYQLENGRRPRVAVISDLPRLSPAEALEDYHKKGLIPPSGADVYSQLKELLSNNLYDVQHINPKDPILPPESDVLLWLQPRRDSTPVINLLSGHLQQGKNAIVALQHFNIQQRQYRGNGFQTVHWPQPRLALDCLPYCNSWSGPALSTLTPVVGDVGSD